MEPTLCAGDVVLVDPSGPLVENTVVVADHPSRPGLRIVKRLLFFDDDDRCYLTGDNPDAADGSDSRTFGPVGRSSVIGPVTSVIGR